MPSQLSSHLPGTPPSRSGQKQLAGYFSLEVVRTLKRLAVDRETTVQSLLAQAINDLFEKHGYARLANEQPLPRGGAAQRLRRQAHSQ
ncbi:MAG TPA: ribbon-helix-helix domain-containing protein [Stellaceae bacterium]|nr:ribbon-helix-helix domain-containing protein [Stellaceae bacterium]